MNEGALLVSPAGLIVYSNAAFAALVASRLETIVGRSLAELVDPRSRTTFDALLAAAASRAVAEELTLRGAHGVALSVLISMSPNAPSDEGISVIVTNLTAQKRNEEIVASERLASSILEQAAEAIVVCDREGTVIRASRAARKIAAGQALRARVLSAFPLLEARHPALRALAGEVVVSVETALKVKGREPLHIVCTAAPLLDDRDEVLGCVMSMTDITAQKRTELERQRLLEAERGARALAEHARSEAEASNRSKDEFLATISHELRTPLNSIVGWSRLVASGSLTEERQRHAIDVIRRNADAQARLVEDLLDVSRIIMGQLRLDVQDVRLARVIAAVIDSVRPALDAKEIRLEADIDEADVMVLGDETRLQQVIWNLLSNAAKFTPARGQIRIALCRHEAGIEISVSDNGEGIDTEFLPYVFDRFRQADAGISRLRGGLGLGLAISRHLVELHGGTIFVESPGPGLGAIFTLRLPSAHLRPASSSEPPRYAPADDADSTRQEPEDLSHVHVLLVEDDADSRDLFVSVLTRCGARVRSTDSGDEALALLEKEVPDVLVSDIGMANMDGYALIRTLRELPLPAARRVPAIALTAYARAEDQQRALREGFQLHLAKPVDPARLASAVADLAKPARQKNTA
jgi:signal transduction histidine kinase/ActR/RegA family two-component response regulator